MSPGKRLAARRAAQQQRELAIGARVLREIVVDDQHVAAGFHEVLGDAGRGVRRDVRQARRVVALGHDDDRVVHRALLAQGGHGLRHGRRALADGAVDAEDVLAALVQNRVDARWPSCRSAGRPGSARAGRGRSGISASMTLRPVCSGTVTGARSMMGAAGRSMGRRLRGGHRAAAVERRGRAGRSRGRASASPTATSMTRPVRSTSSPACRCA